MVNGNAGKGSGIRRGFDWKKYGEQYSKIFHPRCKSCGNIMFQRVGWYNKFHCLNLDCEDYGKIIKGNKNE